MNTENLAYRVSKVAALIESEECALFAARNAWLVPNSDVANRIANIESVLANAVAELDRIRVAIEQVENKMGIQIELEA